MSQKLTQNQQQEQKAVQTQRLTQQQVLAVRLLEMPLVELEQNIQAELYDNPAMEPTVSDDFCDATPTDGCGPEESDGDGATEYSDQSDNAATKEKEERETALDDALSNIGMDDRMPEAGLQDFYGATNQGEEGGVYGEQQSSFYDTMKEQMLELELTDVQKAIMDYLIGSLDADGLLRKPVESIMDELTVYHNINCTEAEVREVIRMLQTFDPAGVGAASLQECLLLQIERKPGSLIRSLMREVVEQCFDDFTKKHPDRIAKQLEVSKVAVEKACAELAKLNPKPGNSLGEAEEKNMMQITPDFIVDTADDGKVSFYINKGNVPELHVSESFAQTLKGYKENKASMSKSDKEALLYVKEKVERAKGYIEAVKQRHQNMYVTMKAIIDIQRRFFQYGDESDIKPMKLKDVADRTGLDLSTISRVSNMKYAQTRWGIFKLRYFFSDKKKTDGGEELSTRKIKLAVKECIDNEDKKKPLSDDALEKLLQQKGLPVARRTIAKYREQMGIPVARLRKK